MRNEEIDPEELSDTLFWAELKGIKDVEFRTIREWIETDGHRIDPDPTDDALPRALQTLINRLASCNVRVCFTDHLSDRELYKFLIDPELLARPIAPLPDCHLTFDVIGGGSDEDNEIYLRYYATDEDRAHWQAQFPNDKLPDHEPLPHDRDRSLP
jgi:hypothetical protein